MPGIRNPEYNSRMVICVSLAFRSTDQEKKETACRLRRARSWGERQRDKKRAPSRFACGSRSASVSCSHRLLTQLLYVAALWSHWDKHVLGWWKHRDDANVLFLKYEDLLKVCNYIERLLLSSFQLFLNKFITFVLHWLMLVGRRKLSTPNINCTFSSQLRRS